MLTLPLFAIGVARILPGSSELYGCAFAGPHSSRDRLGGIEYVQIAHTIDEASLTERLEAKLGPFLVPVILEVLGADAPPSSSSPPAALLTLDQAAHQLGIGRTTLKELIASGRLGSVTIGRRRLVPAQAIDAFVETLQASA